MDERTATKILKDELKRIINESTYWNQIDLNDVTLFRALGIFADLHLKTNTDDEIKQAYQLLNNRDEAEISAWLAGYIDQWRIPQRHILNS